MPNTDVLSQFIDRLADALAARMGGAGPAAAPRAAAKAASTTSVKSAPKSAGLRKGQKRSPELLEKTTSSLLAYIKANSGKRIEEISSALGVSTKELALPAKKLLSAKKIKTKGQKRATKYFA